ncbi:MAG: hypothetical protein H0X30_25460 [Anaerolineae bacterium]|nr:hypothetical protein [Anaerolineae bacterium]
MSTQIKPTTTPHNRYILIGIKTLHTLIFLLMSAAILVVLYCGLTRTYNLWLVIALAAVILECGVFLANNRRCPLTKWARDYGDVTGNDWIADIFLPAWFAPKIPLLCGGLFVVSLIVLAVNFLLLVR